MMESNLTKPSSANTNQMGDGTGYKRPTVAPDTSSVPRLLLGDELLEGENEEAQSQGSMEREESFTSIRQTRYVVGLELSWIKITVQFELYLH